MRLFIVIGTALFLAFCSSGSTPPPASYPMPAPGQWVTYGGAEPQVSNGSFNFGCCNGSLVSGYYYTQFASAPKAGQTLILNYTVTGNSPVWVQAAYGGAGGQSDINPPSLHLFLWRKGDNLVCDAVTSNYRLFASKTNLILGSNQVVSIPLNNSSWTNCNGQNPPNISDILSNLAGAGFTFGGQSFAGHGIYLSSGSATFTINSFTVQ